jgi:hypothetical protein
MLSRRARREAAAAATPDPRLDVIERVLTGFQVAGIVLALGLSVLSWGWLAARGSGGSLGTPGSTRDLAGAGSPVTGGLLGPLAELSGTALVLLMLPACLLMASAVNPFYAPPPGRRVLHTGRTLVFVILALSTVAVIAGAAR